MKAINLLSAATKIEKLVSKHLELASVNIEFKKRKNDLTLSCVVHYKTHGETTNFSAYAYDFRGELTVENLLLEVKKELKILLPKSVI